LRKKALKIATVAAGLARVTAASLLRTAISNSGVVRAPDEIDGSTQDLAISASLSAMSASEVADGGGPLDAALAGALASSLDSVSAATMLTPSAGNATDPSQVTPSVGNATDRSDGSASGDGDAEEAARARQAAVLAGLGGMSDGFLRGVLPGETPREVSTPNLAVRTQRDKPGPRSRLFNSPVGVSGSPNAFSLPQESLGPGGGATDARFAGGVDIVMQHTYVDTARKKYKHVPIHRPSATHPFTHPQALAACNISKRRYFIFTEEFQSNVF
jgi:hypothetical protein